MDSRLRRIRDWIEEPELLLDIGANEGESIRCFKEIWPDCKIISFEPRPNALERLRETAETFQTEVMPFALGSASRVQEITEYSQHPAGSSFLEFTPYHKRTREWSRSSKQVEVGIRRLDDIVLPKLSTVIKLDVEGYSAEVIKGGPETFTRASAAIVEICKNPRYEGAPLLPAITALLAPLGFRLRGIAVDHLDWMDTVWL